MANSDSNNEDTQCQQQDQQHHNQQQQQEQQQHQSPPYTIANIIHFLQYEWQRFESKRQQWELEKAELSARIALLQGERKAHENLKHDLVRRIKMLEYCLRLERAKFHRLKYGVDPPPYSMQEDPSQSLGSVVSKPLQGDENTENTSKTSQENNVNLDPSPNTDSSPLNSNLQSNNFTSNNAMPNNSNNVQCRNGRELLRQYLQEIGYTDTIIDIRSNRVRSLLGIVNNNAAATSELQGGRNSPGGMSNQIDFNNQHYQQQQKLLQQIKEQQGNVASKQHTSEGNATTEQNGQQQRWPPASSTTALPASSIVADTEASVLATFGFLSNYNNSTQRLQGGSAEARAAVNSARATARTRAQQGDDDDDVEDDDDDDVAVNVNDEDIIDDVDSVSTTVATGYSYHYEQQKSENSQVSSNSASPAENTSSLFNRQKPSALNFALSSSSTSTTSGSANVISQDNSNQTSNCVKSNFVGVVGGGGVVASGGAMVDIGELAALTTFSGDNGQQNLVGNEASTKNGKDQQRKTWSTKFILKSHYDCVRALKFHEQDAMLITASEDETIKLWNLNKASTSASHQAVGGKQKQQQQLANAMGNANCTANTPIDLEPIFTYRGHTAPILSLALHDYTIFSGAKNGEIFMWLIRSPIDTIDPYEKFDNSLMLAQFKGHTDCVWSLELMTIPSQAIPILCSASSDMTIKIWDISTSAAPPAATIPIEKNPLLVIDVCNHSPPTCLAIIPQLNHNTSFNCTDLGVAFQDGHIRFYDIAQMLCEANTKKSVTNSLSASTNVFNSTTDNIKASFTESDLNKNTRVNSVAIHPTLPFMVSAHQNKEIKFWDLSKKCHVCSMVAHLEEVTSVVCDPDGTYLLSAAHDCSVRIWNFNDRVCVQEMSPHRKKFDEAIFGVTFHPRLPHFATAGADGLAKVFVSWPSE